MIRFFSALFFLLRTLSAFGQGTDASLVLDHDYDRCERYDYGGWHTISLRFQEGGTVEILSDDYVIRPHFANASAYEAEQERIERLGASVMAKLDARAKMYDNKERTASGTYVVADGLLKIELEDDEILNRDELVCEIDGRYMLCDVLNFVLAKDDVIMDDDVLHIVNVVHQELTFQKAPEDRWVLQIENGNQVLENGDDFLLESFYHPGQFLGHGRDGKLGLFPMDEMEINYNFRFYDTYGQGPVDALEDLKFKPSFFFGDYSYIIGMDQEADNARIDKKFGTQENLWYVEGAMCDIVDEIVGP